MYKKSKIFIAGATGMVGSAIIRKLLGMGYVNLLGSYHSRLPAAGTYSINNGREDIPPELQLVKMDLTRQKEVEGFFEQERPDYVIIAAAKVGGILANNTYAAQFIQENLAIQTNLIHSAYLYGVKRLLFLGSSCIYPKMAPQPMKEEHLLTGQLEATNEPYAIAKIAGIKMCESYNRQYGTCFIAVMPTNLYGSNDNFDLNTSHVMPALIRKFHLAKLAENSDWEGITKDESCFGPIPEEIKVSFGISKSHRSPSKTPTVAIWGTGTPRREFLHVEDMAAACVHVMNTDEETVSRELLNYPNPCFVNMGAGVDCTIHELVEAIRDEVGFVGKTMYDKSKPDGPPQKLLDVTRLEKLCWRSSIKLKDGIHKTYEWYENQIVSKNVSS